mgnify:CR=1 FL=1
MRFVSRSVVTGFVNALAILIFMAQLPELTNVTWHVYAMTAAGLAIIYLLPYAPFIGRLLPSPLVCILVLTGVSIYLGLDIRTVGGIWVTCQTPCQFSCGRMYRSISIR